MQSTSSRQLSIPDAHKMLFEICRDQTSTTEQIKYNLKQWYRSADFRHLSPMLHAPESPDNPERTPVMVAVQANNSAAVEWLLVNFPYRSFYINTPSIGDYNRCLEHNVSYEDIEDTNNNDINSLLFKRRAITTQLMKQLGAHELEENVIQQAIIHSNWHFCSYLAMIQKKAYFDQSGKAYYRPSTVIERCVDFNNKILISKFLKYPKVWESNHNNLEYKAYRVGNQHYYDYDNKDYPLLAGIAILKGNDELVQTLFRMDSKNGFESKENFYYKPKSLSTPKDSYRDIHGFSFVCYVLQAIQETKPDAERLNTLLSYIRYFQENIDPAIFSLLCNAKELEIALATKNSLVVKYIMSKIYFDRSSNQIVKVQTKNAPLCSDLLKAYYADQNHTHLTFDFITSIIKAQNKSFISAQAIALAIKQRDEPMIKFLLQNCKPGTINEAVDENALQDDRMKDYFPYGEKIKHANFTCLQYASRLGDINLVNLLLSFGAELNCREPGSLFEKYSPALNDAARMGYIDIVKLFLDKGADGGFFDHDNYSVLSFYVDKNYYLRNQEAQLTYSQYRTQNILLIIRILSINSPTATRFWYDVDIPKEDMPLLINFYNLHRYEIGKWFDHKACFKYYDDNAKRFTSGKSKPDEPRLYLLPISNNDAIKPIVIEPPSAPFLELDEKKADANVLAASPNLSLINANVSSARPAILDREPVALEGVPRPQVANPDPIIANPEPAVAPKPIAEGLAHDHSLEELADIAKPTVLIPARNLSPILSDEGKAENPAKSPTLKSVSPIPEPATYFDEIEGEGELPVPVRESKRPLSNSLSSSSASFFNETKSANPDNSAELNSFEPGSTTDSDISNFLRRCDIRDRYTAATKRFHEEVIRGMEVCTELQRECDEEALQLENKYLLQINSLQQIVSIANSTGNSDLVIMNETLKRIEDAKQMLSMLYQRNPSLSTQELRDERSNQLR